MMKNGVLLVAVAALLTGCCFGNPSWVVSPKRLSADPKPLADAIDKLKADLCAGKTLKQCDLGKLQIIGHGAASFRHYPMNTTDEGRVDGNNWWWKRAAAVGVSGLMDQAFESRRVDAVEIDLHAPEDEHPLCGEVGKEHCVFVIHDPPKWKMLAEEGNSSEAYRYLTQNTLSKVLGHFIREEYPSKEKALYLELKAPEKCMPPAVPPRGCNAVAVKAADRVVALMGATRAGEGREADGGSWLTVVSFFPDLLEAFHRQVNGRLGNRVGYALIAGYDDKGCLGIKSRVAQCKGPVPWFFEESIQEFATTRRWLDTIWFSLNGIGDPVEIFGDLSEKRRAFFEGKGEEYRALNYSVSAYDHRGVVRKMKGFELPLVSAMIDVDEHRSSTPADSPSWGY